MFALTSEIPKVKWEQCFPVHFRNCIENPAMVDTRLVIADTMATDCDDESHIKVFSH